MLMETPINLKNDKLQGRKTLKVTGFLEEFEIDDIKKRVDIIELFESFGVKLDKKGKSLGFIGLPISWNNLQEEHPG